jgi:cellulose synthase/poly-beta-1,6-N-acetylglucosamine synthase-like glycosyltransferase
MISIIIPAFNASKTINACIESLLSQKASEKFEVIIVDDGSMDNTAEVVKKFKKVKLVQQENKGPASARNNGARHAKGNIIVFIDSDCVAGKNWLEEMILPFNNLEVVGVQGTYKSMQKELMARFEQLRIMQRHEKMRKQQFIDFIGSFSAAFRKTAFFPVKGFDENYPMASGEDTDLSFKLSAKGRKLVFASKAVVWHQHPVSFWKYLRVKFYRAFWRIPLYKSHKNKLVKDSYTSFTIKAQMGIAVLSILSFIASLLFSAFWISTIALLALIPTLNLGFFFWAFRKDALVAFFSFVINFFESFALAFGMLSGFANLAFGGFK